MNDTIFAIGVDMENRSAEDAAKEVALKIIRITDELISMQEAEKKKKDKQK